MSKKFKFIIRLKNCIMFDVFSIIAKKPVIKEHKMKFFGILAYLPSLLIAKILIKISSIITRSKKDPKNSSMYKPLCVFFVMLGIYCTINILPTSKQVLYIMNKIFRIVVTYYITRIIKR